MIDLKTLRAKATYDANEFISTFIDPLNLIELLDMLEAAQKDAARYRVVRYPFSKGDFSNLYLEELDASIDAAMQS